MLATANECVRYTSKAHQSYSQSTDHFVCLAFYLPFIFTAVLTSHAMYKSALPRAARSLLPSRATPQVGPSNLRHTPRFQVISQSQLQRRGYATEAPEYDVLFIGGGVAGYVGAIKAGQEGLKVNPNTVHCPYKDSPAPRQHVSRSEAHWAVHV